jgi:hypothetical protein
MFSIPQNFLALGTLVALSTASSAFAQLSLPASGNLPITQVPTPQLRRPIPIQARQCPNPAAHRIDFRILNRTSQFRGQVQITGVVKNLGNAAYISNPNQQSIHLYEGSRLVTQKPFQNLTPGQEVTVTYTRSWDASSPSEGEFPPTYKLLIVYDPDIRLDGNPRNDDCNAANNQKQRSGADINALFR